MTNKYDEALEALVKLAKKSRHEVSYVGDIEKLKETIRAALLSASEHLEDTP